MKICRLRPQLVFTFDNRFSSTGCALCRTTVCPVHNFPPPSELLVCYQPHRQGVMPGQKSIYETFLFKISSLPHGDDSSPPPLCGLIFFEGDRCLCLTPKVCRKGLNVIQLNKMNLVLVLIIIIS